MSELDLSIIVPIYNTEKYLKRCVMSLLELEGLNYEILLINDGSLDGSEGICKELEANNSKIHYYYQINQGVSVARNNGIAHASGKYITFVDSDDYWLKVNSDSIIKAVKTDSDLIYCTGYYREDERHRVQVNRDHIKIEGSIFNSIVKETFKGGWANWLYFFKSDIIKQHYLSYRTGIRVAEDAEFFFSFCKFVSTISFIENPYYVYLVERNQSAMNSGRGKALMSFFELLTYRLQEEKDEMDVAINRILVSNFHGWLQYSYLIEKKHRSIICDFLNENHLELYLDEKSYDYKFILRNGYKIFIKKQYAYGYLKAAKNEIKKWVFGKN